MDYFRPSIFRMKTYQRYMERHDKPVFPKLVSPKVIVILWVSLGLMAIGGVIVGAIAVPVYAPAIATVTGRSVDDPNNAVILLLLPPEYLPRLRVGQRVFFKLNDNQRQIRGITEFEPQVLSPQKIQARFALDAGVSSKLSGAAAVAFATLEPTSKGQSGSDYLGSRFDAQVEVGTRKIISFVSWVE